jgi:integrase
MSTDFHAPAIPAAPAHTPGHIDCPACNAHRLRIMEPVAFGQLTFAQAAPLWLDSHRAEISAKTIYDYEYYIRMLTKFFGALPLKKIHIGNIQAYQFERSETAGASCVNHEINTLKQVLERAGLWTDISKFYRSLRVPKSKAGRALEPADEERLMRTAASSRYWRIAYWCSIVTATTTAGPKEITHLHVNDVEIGERPGAPLGTMRIRDGLKNGYRERIIPLNEASSYALRQILNRYQRICRELGVVPDPEHYILPGRGRSSPYDPWKPMGSWRTAWRSLRKAAGFPGLRMYDLRHHAITKLMEDPDVSEQTVEEVAGHALSSAMKKRYSHIRIKPKAHATAKLELRLPRKPTANQATTRKAARSGFVLVTTVKVGK